MSLYRYLPRAPGEASRVAFDIYEQDQYRTTCTVSIPLLLCGAKTFPCSNGDTVHLTWEQQLDILALVQAETNQRRKTHVPNSLPYHKEESA